MNRGLAARELEPQERLDWLRLARTETIGPITFYALLRRFGSAHAALEAVPQLSRRDVTVASRADAERELAALDPSAPVSCAGVSRFTPKRSKPSRTRRQS